MTKCAFLRGANNVSNAGPVNDVVFDAQLVYVKRMLIVKRMPATVQALDCAVSKSVKVVKVLEGSATE